MIGRLPLESFHVCTKIESILPSYVDDSRGRHERTLEEATELHEAEAVAASAFQDDEGVSRDRELAWTLCYDILTTGETAIIDDAYKVYHWVTKLFRLFPLAPSADIEAIGREAEASRPPGVRMEHFMPSASFFGRGRSVCATASSDIGRIPFGTWVEDLVYFQRRHRAISAKTK